MFIFLYLLYVFIPGFVFALLEGEFISHSNSKVQILMYELRHLLKCEISNSSLSFCLFFFLSYFNSVLLFSENSLLFICFLLCIFFCLFSVILTFPPRRLQIVLLWGVISYFLSDGLATDTQIWSNCVNIYQLGTIGEGILHYSILLTC